MNSSCFLENEFKFIVNGNSNGLLSTSCIRCEVHNDYEVIATFRFNKDVFADIESKIDKETHICIELCNTEGDEFVYLVNRNLYLNSYTICVNQESHSFLTIECKFSDNK